ncbi:MAG: PQQ-binding-like beta-propeller repeat protein [Myxococcota bacterium]
MAGQGIYSGGGWSTLHRGPANRKLVPSAPLGGEYAIWTALPGAAVLTAPTMSPDGQTLYVASGKGSGFANLHAFGLDGKPLWNSGAWTDPAEGVDPCAILSSPIVDAEGDIYLGDCNQLFAYRPDGQRKWVVDLPSVQAGDWVASERIPINALTTAVFTRAGHVLGVTNAGDIIVVDRATGQILNAPTRLPGLVPPPSPMPMPDSIFGEGLVDPEIRDWSWQLLFGGAMRSANTPAVEMRSGRVFVAATSTSPGKGALYALDLDESSGAPGSVAIEIAFSTDMGPGSGSSPSLSPSGHQVYVSDEEGMFYGVDAKTGEIVWNLQTKAASAAAAVGANGDVYTLQADGPALIAMTESGERRWESDLDALAAAALPKGFLLGEPLAWGNGNPTVVGDRVLVPVMYGYPAKLGRREILMPVLSSLVAVDMETGVGLRNLVELEDDSTGITSVLPDGTIVSSLGTALTSGVSPLSGLARMIMPGGHTLLEPLGGIQVSRPKGSGRP